MKQIQQMPGLPCPECKFPIKMTIEDLLYGQEIKCPSCSLVLKIDKGRSRRSLELLQDIHVAVKRVESMKKQSL